MNNIYKAKKIHLVGIKGVGMTALAQMLQSLNIKVHGSDTDEKFITDDILKRLKIKTFQGFYPKNIDPDTDLIISSVAYTIKNKDSFVGLGLGGEMIKHAVVKNIPILTFPEAIAQLFNDSFGIAVAGTHGKSTTSAMVAVMLEYCRKDPRAIIGTKVINWQSNARTSGASLQKTPFVLEADEYKDAFLNYVPNIIVLTNIEWDHPDYFKSYSAYKKSFNRFLSNLDKKGSLIYCMDDKGTADLSSKSKIFSKLSYGFSAKSRLQITSWQTSQRGTSFGLYSGQNNLGTFYIKLFGKHNVLNAASVVALGLILRLPIKNIKAGIAAFDGTARRFETISNKPRIIIDDYAHHPSEISATIAAAKNAWPGRNIIVLFQPHTFSRTKALFRDFIKALKAADRTFILKTYASAREKIITDASGKLLAKKLNTWYFSNNKVAIQKLNAILRDNDVLVTMGAGDVWKIGRYLKNSKW